MLSIVSEEIENYARQHSTPSTELLRELEIYTRQHCDMPQMLVGPLEGRLLHLLVKLCGAEHILEIGLFTGYSALSMAAALPASGKIISCEIDSKHAEIAQSFIDRSPYRDNISIRLGPALDTIANFTSEQPFDMVFLDADKENYCNYFNAVLPKLKSGGLIVADNVLWSGSVLNPTKETDQAVVAFNELVQHDNRVENVMLTVRDGVMLIRKID